MAITERKYGGALTLGRLELALENNEVWFGGLTKLEAVGSYTVATYDDSNNPPVSSLGLLPTIGGTTPPAPAGTQHLFNGEALVLGQPIGVAVFRTH